MKERKKYRTVVLSDIHLGSKYSKVAQAADFLASVDAETLIFNGDTIDGWQLQKKDNAFWGVEHSRFFRIIMKMVEQHGTEVYFLRGNHDDFLDKIIPMIMGKLNILKDMILESGGKKFFVTHGDVFDNVTSHMKWVAKLGSVMYNILLIFNALYNRMRAMFGKPYYSFSQAIKNILPALCNEGIVLLKETSVSGYIGLIDLTKGGDIIRSQTYEAFMPYIAVALIYLTVVVILTHFVKKLEVKLNAS